MDMPSTVIHHTQPPARVRIHPDAGDGPWRPRGALGLTRFERRPGGTVLVWLNPDDTPGAHSCTGWADPSGLELEPEQPPAPAPGDPDSLHGLAESLAAVAAVLSTTASRLAEATPAARAALDTPTCDRRCPDGEADDVPLAMRAAVAYIHSQDCGSADDADKDQLRVLVERTLPRATRILAIQHQWCGEEKEFINLNGWVRAGETPYAAVRRYAREGALTGHLTGQDIGALARAARLMPDVITAAEIAEWTKGNQ